MKTACSAALKTKNRPYDNRPGSEAGRRARHALPDASAVRVVMPDEPPVLTSEVAKVLLRILIKARDRLADNDTTQGGAE